MNDNQQLVSIDTGNVISFPIKHPAEQLIDQWLTIEGMPNGIDKLLQASIWRGDVKRFSHQKR